MVKVKTVRVSQQQIARDLGVSQTLVSMVLNGRRQGVSEGTYRQIWDHAERSGYRPKGMAPELMNNGSSTKTVGFVLRSGSKLYSENPFFSHVQQGAHATLVERGISLVFLGMEGQLSAARLKELYVDRRNYRGILVMGEISRTFLHSLRELEPRIVTIAAQYPGLCHSVISNEEQAADQLVQHLYDQGHRRFAWLGGNAGMQRAFGHYGALSSALERRNLMLEERFCMDRGGADRLHGREAAAALLQVAGRDELPTAWIAFNGPMARGAANFLLQQGIRIPEDLSFATFDCTRICEEDYPTLTGAGTSPEEIGRVACEHLLREESDPIERFSDTVLAAQLVVRESTGRVASKRGGAAIRMCAYLTPQGE